MRETILKNNVSAKAGHSFQLLVHIRNLSSTRLFVGGLSFGTSDQQLKEAFSSFGPVTDARVIMDRETGRSRGFGFVSYENDDDASSAKSGLDGQELNGRSIRITYAKDDRRPARFGGESSGNQGNGSHGEGSGGQGEL